MDNVHSIGDVVSSLFSNISAKDLKETGQALSVWKKILFSLDEKQVQRDGIPSRRGENLYYHSKIVDFKNGMLLIEVDHPGWIQMFQVAQTYIVRGFKKFAPELKVSSLSYRLTGQTASFARPRPGESGPESPRGAENPGKIAPEMQEMEKRCLNGLTHQKKP